MQPQWGSTTRDWMPAWLPDGKYSVVSRYGDIGGELWALRETAGVWAGQTRQSYQLTHGAVDFSGVAAAPGMTSVWPT